MEALRRVSTGSDSRRASRLGLAVTGVLIAAMALPRAARRVPPPSTAAQPTVGPRLDPSFALLALDALDSNDPSLRQRLVSTAAAHHLGAHARRVAIGGDRPTDRQLVDRILVSARVAHLQAPAVRLLVRQVVGDTVSLARCWSEAARYLPPSALRGSTLYLQIGYDIGVAVAGDASLNVANRHFLADPDEIWFYCVHEMHHAGVEHFHDLPTLSRVETTQQLVALVRYLTFLEGMAVHAARAWRAERGALARDSDYAALEDSSRMRRDEQEYFRIYDSLAAVPARRLQQHDWSILDRLSSGERLWYRVGALMAGRIERRRGLATLRDLVVAGPDAFFDAYDSIHVRPGA